MFFIRYSGALLYDAVILLVLFFVVTALILIVNQGNSIPPATHWYQLFLISVNVLYYYYSIQLGGQTIGMRAWRFKLMTPTQDKLSKKQIFTRIVYFIPAFLLAPFYFKSSFILLNQWTKTEFFDLT